MRFWPGSTSPQSEQVSSLSYSVSMGKLLHRRGSPKNCILRSMQTLVNQTQAALLLRSSIVTTE